MECYIQDLYVLQNTLDERIFKQHQVSRNETMTRRQLALLIELGELANETRCFKFWSNKPSSDQAIVLEEYADGIHFLLSIGIDLHDDTETLSSMKMEGDTHEAFLMIYNFANECFMHCSIKSYHLLFQAYLGLGEKLGFTSDDIRNYYLKKNEINHHRQDTNY